LCVETFIIPMNDLADALKLQISILLHFYEYTVRYIHTS
jgi:hypothetical protein